LPKLMKSKDNTVFLKDMSVSRIAMKVAIFLH